MKLIVGLGNPGKEYEFTRHNVGFMILDSYLNNETWKKKFEALYQIKMIEGEKVLFLKPQTFMNLSGKAVLQAVKFYDIKSQNILIVHDDLDLPFETFKLKFNSSSGGHNGIKSIINSLGTESFARLKIGIANNQEKDTIDFVLGKFSKKELNYLKDNFNIYEDIIESFITNGIDKTMNDYNKRG